MVNAVSPAPSQPITFFASGVLFSMLNGSAVMPMGLTGAVSLYRDLAFVSMALTKSVNIRGRPPDLPRF